MAPGPRKFLAASALQLSECVLSASERMPCNSTPGKRVYVPLVDDRDSNMRLLHIGGLQPAGTSHHVMQLMGASRQSIQLSAPWAAQEPTRSGNKGDPSSPAARMSRARTHLAACPRYHCRVIPSFVPGVACSHGIIAAARDSTPPLLQSP
jgi:hypothetical protein